MSTHKPSFRSTLLRMVNEDGPGSVYRGFVPNAVKNLPNKGKIVSFAFG